MIVLIGLVGAAAYVWLSRTQGVDARALGGTTLDDATSRLGRVGSEIQDAKVKASVKTALSLNRNLEPFSIEVGSEGGVVTLAGNVSRDDLKQTALQIAAAVPDVRQVNDQLRVDNAASADPGDGRTVGEALDDRALEAKVNLAFSLNRNLQGTDVGVKAFRRQVVLEGDVARDDQRQLALAIAQQTPNVLGVTDQIRVAGQPSRTEGAAAPAALGPQAETAPAPAGAATTPSGAPAAAPDSGAAPAAEKAIAANPNLAPYGLRAEEKDGRLVLTGRVRTGAEKDLAGVLARQAAGLPLDNAVDVRP
jgi:hyperosmotically inducible protein